MLGFLAATKMPAWDIGFFVACAVIIGLIVGIYFLIPVFNKKQYQEQRDNLKKREAAFKANKGVVAEEEEMVEAPETPEATPETSSDK